LIISATLSGQIVSRTGRYRTLIFGALLVMSAGLFTLTNLRADTPVPLLWAWMFVAGLGVGPTFAVFTLIVQNAVPIARLGTATSNLTFFQQVGGTVGLAITGTIFGTTLADEVPRQLGAAGIPPEVGSALATGGGLDALTGVGDLGSAILAATPDAVRAQVEPFVPAIVEAIYRAFSIATASTFILGVGAAALAAGLVLMLREVPMRAYDPSAAASKANGLPAIGETG
jgi:MFS family permease